MELSSRTFSLNIMLRIDPVSISFKELIERDRFVTKIILMKIDFLGALLFLETVAINIIVMVPGNFTTKRIFESFGKLYS